MQQSSILTIKFALIEFLTCLFVMFVDDTKDTKLINNSKSAISKFMLVWKDRKNVGYMAEKCSKKLVLV